MKVIRLTDDRYIFDLGPKATMASAAAAREMWEKWWTTGSGIPTAFFIRGEEIPIEYEDARDPDAVQMARIEEKLDRLLDILS